MGALQEMALWTGGNRSNRSKGVNFCLSFGAVRCPTFVCEVRIGAAWARYSKCEVLLFLDTACVMLVIEDRYAFPYLYNLIYRWGFPSV